jgi:DNA-binding NarL/FixJ family response regulator
MKVLIYDNDHNDIEHFHGLLENIPFDMDIKKYTDYSALKNDFKLEKHDLIFIDMDSDNSVVLLKYIKEQSPQQRVVVFNNSLDCVEKKGCEYCKETYNQSRIIKPANYQDIIYVLKNAHCEYNYCDADILTKLVVLSKPFHTLKLDMNSLQVHHSNSNSNLAISNTIDFTKLLDKNNIKFDVLENYIQIYS